MRKLLFLLAFATACTGSSHVVVHSGAPDPAQAAPSSPAAAQTEAWNKPYPETRRDNVVEYYFGTKVVDRFRWLEDDRSEETAAWVEAQNKVTFAHLEKLPRRAAIGERLTKLWDYEKYGVPRKEGGRYFFTKNDGLQNQSVLYWAKSLSKKPKVLLDPNKLSADGTVALKDYEISPNGKYMAYGMSRAGSDWVEWKVKEVKSGRDLGDHLKWVKFSNVAWSPTNKGFFYARYPEPSKGDKLKGVNLNQRLYYHRLGDSQDKDLLVYANPAEPKWGFGAEITEDGDYLIMSVWQGTGEKNLVYVANLKEARKRQRQQRRAARKGGVGKPTPIYQFYKLVGDWKSAYRFIGNRGARFYFRTNDEAAKGRVIQIHAERNARDTWKEIVPESSDTLRGVSLVGGRLIVSYMSDAKSKILEYSLKGKKAGELSLPGIGTASGFGGKDSDKETFYRFTSYNTPGSVFRYDLKRRKSSVFREAKVDFDRSRYVTSQVFYKSKDGTQVPMFISHRKGLEKNGKNPTLLYGYGGFNISLTPYFSVSNLVWMEMGGVLAIPNLRGGGEYGREWHEAGTKLRKQNVFDDFIAAAEYLIAQNYTASSRLAIKGGSNGGLLVGAVMTQRPELFAAAIPAVGVLDMLRFHKFTIGWAWVDDYGSSENEKEFEALLAYSPYHNLKAGTRYPSTMITTADHDDRVVPAHSFKFAAALQRAHAGKNPVLIRIQTKAGHGAGKPTKVRIEEGADVLAFLWSQLGGL